MQNPWLEIPLEDYESHMALPSVGQAPLLAQLLGQAIARYQPSSIALLGCAGGNGLEHIHSSSVTRVVGIDINPHYLEHTAARYRSQIPCLELFAGNLESDQFTFAPVELIFAGLIFEYVEATQLLKQALSMLTTGGRLVAVIQLPSQIAEVTPSPYTALKRIASVLHVVPLDKLTSLAREVGFDIESEHVVTATGGKDFQVYVFRRVAPAQA